MTSMQYPDCDTHKVLSSWIILALWKAADRRKEKKHEKKTKIKKNNTENKIKKKN